MGGSLVCLQVSVPVGLLHMIFDAAADEEPLASACFISHAPDHCNKGLAAAFGHVHGFLRKLAVMWRPHVQPTCPK